MVSSDYERFDLLIGMDHANIRNMQRICCGDTEGKIHLLMEYAGKSEKEVSDPWYTDDFETAYQDIYTGCVIWLDRILKVNKN